MDKLNILWTSNSRETFFYMLSMYATNSIIKGWWSSVNIIIWGASAQLVGKDTQVQSEIIEMLHQGITIEACKGCCDNFGVTDTLVKLGVNVRYMGEPFTVYLKNNEKIISI